MENTSDLDNNDSGPSEVSAHGSRNSDEETHNNYDMKAWDSANEHLSSILRLTTTTAARSVRLKSEPRNGQLENDRQA